MIKQETLCWDCQNCSPLLCRKIATDNASPPTGAKTIDGYVVSCPNFKPDDSYLARAKQYQAKCIGNLFARLFKKIENVSDKQIKFHIKGVQK